MRVALAGTTGRFAVTTGRGIQDPPGGVARRGSEADGGPPRGRAAGRGPADAGSCSVLAMPPGARLADPYRRATQRVVARLNLTLDDVTFERLREHAKLLGKPYARLGSEMLREGLERREAAERRRSLARHYAAGRADAGALLRELEAAQTELLGDEDA